jgi:hypothetical protein
MCGMSSYLEVRIDHETLPLFYYVSPRCRHNDAGVSIRYRRARVKPGLTYYQ